jgi:dTMP kinase
MYKSFKSDIIVIDGADGVGKTTQVALLKEKLKNKCNFMKFPNYDSTTGYFITKYLEGKFENVFEGLDELDKINKISMLYTMDRSVWFAKDYEPYIPLICDRYTTSNIIHMAALIIHNGGTIDDVYHYINNLETLEYSLLNIPEPDLVIYLDAPTEQLAKNLKGTQQVLDIHEDESIFKEIESVKREIIDYCGWKVVNCTDGNGMRSVENINNDIIKIINEYYDKKIK